MRQHFGANSAVHQRKDTEELPRCLYLDPIQKKERQQHLFHLHTWMVLFLPTYQRFLLHNPPHIKHRPDRYKHKKRQLTQYMQQSEMVYSSVMEHLLAEDVLKAESTCGNQCTKHTQHVKRKLSDSGNGNTHDDGNKWHIDLQRIQWNIAGGNVFIFHHLRGLLFA